MSSGQESSVSNSAGAKRPATATSSQSTAAIVDLTEDNTKSSSSDEQDINANQGRTAIHEDDEAHEEEQEEEDEETLPLLYSLTNRDYNKLKIVGIRYYRGVAHQGEYVRLSREPHNPYDSNAIRVDNLRGEKVGHVAKEAAAVLSPIIDAYPQFTLDATIPSRGTQFFHPLQLDIRAPNVLFDTLRPLLQPLVPKGLRAQRPLESSSQQEQKVSVKTKKVDWKKQQAEMDELWQNALHKQLQGLADVPIPAALTSTLYAHQIQGLQWLVHKESGPPNPFFETVQEAGKTMYLCQLTQSSQPNAPRLVKGSILADVMGLGKSLTTLALILAQPPPGVTFAPGRFAPMAAAIAPKDAQEDNDDGVSQPIQTLAEIRAHSVANLRKAAARLFLENHSTTKKAQLVQVFHQALTAGTITPKALKEAMMMKSTPTACAGSQASACRPVTLIVAPVSVLQNWQDQIDAHVTPFTLRVGFYQGQGRHAMLTTHDEYDIWITSYHTLQADYKAWQRSQPTASGNVGNQKPPAKKLKASSIFQVPFFRVVLDEGHIIKNPRAGMARACHALEAERRLLLTGTPLTNKPEDIQSLLHFLRLEPFGDRDIFRRAIAQPLKEGDERGLTNLRLSMAFTALRRNKDTISLPEKTVELRSVTTSKNNAHLQIYDTIYQAARAALGAVLKQPDAASAKMAHASIFEVLTRLRQACCSGTLVPKERLLAAEQVLQCCNGKDNLSVEEGQALLEKLKGALVQGDNDADAAPECAICMDELTAVQAVVLRHCGHVYCNSCLTKTLEFKTACAFCRKPYTQDDLIPYQEAEAASTALTDVKPTSLTEDWMAKGPSPKMNALLMAVNEMEADEKGVVFSQFTKFLDQLGRFLTENGWSFVRIDGSKSRAQRVQAMKEFGAEGGPRLVLCSLHAAGTGINLTRGNHVFIMDTWWNKAVEQQSQDRIHRLGQTRPCRVVRFVVADSIESRMVELQEAKHALAKGAFENLSPDEKRKARMSDLKKLLEL